MTKKQFEQQLKTQAYAAVPDKREDLLKTVAAQDAAIVSLSDDGDEPHLVPVVPAKQTKRWLALAACFAVVLVAVLLSVTAGDKELTKTNVVQTGDATTVAGTPGVTAVPTGFVPSGMEASDTEQSGMSGTARGSLSGGTNVTGTASGSVSGGTNVTGTASGSASGDTTKKGEPTSEKNSAWWADFSVDTTKKVPGGATTQKTVAPSAHPTTKRTTEPTAPRPTCSHEVIYTPPLPADIRAKSDKVNTCIEYIEAIEPTVPAEPTVAPTTQRQSNPTIYGEGRVEFKGYYPNSGGVYYVHCNAAAAIDVRYFIITEVDFADGWRMQFSSECTENEILYTTVRKYTDTGVCVYEEKYDERSEIMTITRRDRNGTATSSETRKIPLRSPEFSEIDVY